MDAAHHHNSASIQQKVLHAIAPWKTKNKRPPFTVNELVVMALVVLRKPAKSTNIHSWIMNTFRYYRKLAIGLMWSYNPKDVWASDFEWAPSEFKSEFIGAFRTFSVPISSTSDSNEITGGKDGVDGHHVYGWAETSDWKWTVKDADANIYLRKAVQEGASTTQKFPFMRLPAELRIKVYSMVLGLPQAGVCVRMNNENDSETEYGLAGMEVSTLSRSFEDLSTDINWSKYASGRYMTYNSGRPAGMLQLLLVNKEIHEEAVPIFYSINHFACRTIEHLHQFLEGLHPNRRQHLGHISFTWSPNDSSAAAKAFKILVGIKYLQRLDVFMSEAEWKAVQKRNGEKPFDDILKVPGLPTLRSIRGLKTVNFYGDCDTIRPHLAPEMRKPKPTKRASNGKKRKGCGGAKGGAQSSTVTERAKKAKGGSK